MTFNDRADAGRCMARRLGHLRGSDAVVLGVVRGGVPVAYEVALAVGAPLDILVVRRIEAPYQAGLTVGAVAQHAAPAVDPAAMRRAGLDTNAFAEIVRNVRVDLDELADRLREGRPPIGLTARTAIVVDDGVMTGLSAQAACRSARALGCDRVILAVPVAPADVVPALCAMADETVCARTPPWLPALSTWYRDFTPTSEADVRALLREAVTAGHGPG